MKSAIFIQDASTLKWWCGFRGGTFEVDWWTSKAHIAEPFDSDEHADDFIRNNASAFEGMVLIKVSVCYTE